MLMFVRIANRVDPDQTTWVMVCAVGRHQVFKIIELPKNLILLLGFACVISHGYAKTAQTDMQSFLSLCCSTMPYTLNRSYK